MKNLFFYEKILLLHQRNLGILRYNHPKYLSTLDYNNLIIEGIQKKNGFDRLLVAGKISKK